MPYIYPAKFYVKCEAVTMEAEASDSCENRRESSVSFKEGETKVPIEPTSPTPKIPKKFINNWRHACDKTKDRTKEFLKKWRTLPESGQPEGSLASQSIESTTESPKWSEHVWNTWVKRSPTGEETSPKFECLAITETQRKKFEHFFISYLDLDRDDVISLADFDAFSERIRHFSDWSTNSSEYHRLKEVQRGFIETFLLPPDLESPIHSYELLEEKIKKEQLSLDQWLSKWAEILNECQHFYKLPLWLQYFPKILFNALNRSGSGTVTKEEIHIFFSLVLGLSSVQIGPFTDKAYDVLTSNNRHPLTYSVYRLCFANFLFGRYPNGPGQYIFGPITGIEDAFFPIGYAIFNSNPQEIEQYSPQKKSNRISVIV